MSVLSLEEKGHIAHSLAALTHFGRALLTSRVQSNPQHSAYQAQTTGNKHATLTWLIVTVVRIRAWTGYCHFSWVIDSLEEVRLKTSPQSKTHVNYTVVHNKTTLSLILVVPATMKIAIRLWKGGVTMCFPNSTKITLFYKTCLQASATKDSGNRTKSSFRETFLSLSRKSRQR